MAPQTFWIRHLTSISLICFRHRSLTTVAVATSSAMKKAAEVAALSSRATLCNACQSVWQESSCRTTAARMALLAMGAPASVGAKKAPLESHSFAAMVRLAPDSLT